MNACCIPFQLTIYTHSKLCMHLSNTGYRFTTLRIFVDPSLLAFEIYMQLRLAISQHYIQINKKSAQLTRTIFFRQLLLSFRLNRVHGFKEKKIEGIFKRILIIFEPEDVVVSRHKLLLASFHFLVIYTLIFFKSNIQCIF